MDKIQLRKEMLNILRAYGRKEEESGRKKNRRNSA